MLKRWHFFSNDRVQLVQALAKGAFLGLVWGSSLRTWMVVLALEFGDYPRFTWDGTFAFILIPATIMGAVLNGARVSIKQGDKRWRWAVLAPLLLVLGPLLFMKDFIPTLLSTGMGGGAIGVALIGLFGGYGFSGGGANWRKIVAKLLAILIIGATVYGVFFTSQSQLELPTARQTFGALYFILLMVLLIVATALPYQEQTGADR